MNYSIHNEFLTVSADEFGAQLSSIRDNEGIEYLWQGDEKYWADRALNLFPYVARLYNGEYILDGQTFNMDIHGFAPYMNFKHNKLSDSCMEMSLSDNEETMKQFPRKFCFTIRYALEGKTLKVTFNVENRDEKAMYFGLGGHPGFNVPLIEGTEFNDYRLRFSNKCTPTRFGFTDNSLLNGKDEPFALIDDSILPLSHSMFDNDAIVLRDMAKSVTLECDGDPHSVTVSFPGMDYLGFWHWPQKDAPYVCIEPWCTLPSVKDEITVFERKKDLLKLDIGEKYSNTWTITINN